MERVPGKKKKPRDHQAVLRAWRTLMKKMVSFTVFIARSAVQLLSVLVKAPHMTSCVVPGRLVKNLSDLQRGKYLSAKQREAYQVDPGECGHENGFRKYGANYKTMGSSTLRICDLCGCRYLRVSGKGERPEQWKMISPRPNPNSSKKKVQKKKADHGSAVQVSTPDGSGRSSVPWEQGYQGSAPGQLRGGPPVAVNLSRGPAMPLVGGLPTQAAAPTCPVDSSHPMRVRINNEYGTLFWGCSKYPECKGVRDIPKAFQPTVVSHGPVPVGRGASSSNSWGSWVKMPSMPMSPVEAPSVMTVPASDEETSVDSLTSA